MSASRTGGSAFGGTGRPGASASGAFCWVRFLWSLTFEFVGDRLQVLRSAQDDSALSYSRVSRTAIALHAGEALDDVAMLRVLRGERIALCHFEVGEVEAGGDGAAD
jgi:hypothetical protein